MKDIQNHKSINIIATLALVIGIVALLLAFFSDSADVSKKSSMYQIGGLLTALAVILFVLSFQIKRRVKNKKNRYHAVHWNNGQITKD